MAFDSFYGNEALKENIANMIDNNKLPHAIILQGENGLGKKTFANLIAAALLCKNEKKPCLNCASCRNVLGGNHSDVLYYESEKHTKNNFSVEKVRAIRESAYVKPNQSDYKVFIVGEADLMNISAQNAFLKVLEEPPAYAVFILLAQSKSSFIQTILSRATVFTLERVTDEQAKECVKNILNGPTDEEISKAVDLIGGNIGKVIDGLKGEDIITATQKALGIGRAVVADKEFELLSALADFEDDRQLLKNTAPVLTALFRDALAYRSSGEILIKINQETAKLIAGKLTKKQIYNLLEVSIELPKRINKNANHKLLITWLCSALRKATEF